MNYQDPELIPRGTHERHTEGSLPDVFQLVERLSKKLRGVQRYAVALSDLTPPQYVVLAALWERDSRPLKELAEVAHCTPATITGIVDVLERKELLVRRANPSDRRSMLVDLTERGRALEATTPTLGEMLGDCCRGLRPDQSAQLAELLRILDTSLDSWEVPS